MAFSDFNYPDVLQAFKLSESGTTNLFADAPAVTAGALAMQALTFGSQLAFASSTDKARSEWLIAPILLDFWSRHSQRIGLFSGVELDADPDNGLMGICDFIVGRTPQRLRVHSPVAVIFEAKRDNIMESLGPCIAGMVGIQRFNKREGTPVDPVYGCVTTGASWRLLRLAGSVVTIDIKEYNLAEVDKLLGILTCIAVPVTELAASESGSKQVEEALYVVRR